MRGLPEVLVTYSRIYNLVLSGYHGRELALTDIKRGRRQAAKIQKEWDAHSGRILPEMTRISGLRWKRKEIRAYVVSSVRYPFSEPLTLWIGEKRENLDGQVTSMVHELAHTLFDDNDKMLAGYWKRLRASLAGETDSTIVHVPVHGLMVETFRAVFGNDCERYLKQERWWERSKANPDMKESYSRSWNIVKEEGAAKVMKRLFDARDVSDG
jgi:hypothetical protein